MGLNRDGAAPRPVATCRRCCRSSATERIGRNHRGLWGNKSTNPSTTTTPSTTTATTTASTTAPAPSQNNITPTGGNQFTPVAPANPPTALYPHTRTPY